MKKRYNACSEHNEWIRRMPSHRKFPCRERCHCPLSHVSNELVPSRYVYVLSYSTTSTLVPRSFALHVDRILCSIPLFSGSVRVRGRMKSKRRVSHTHKMSTNVNSKRTKETKASTWRRNDATGPSYNKINPFAVGIH